MAAQSPQLQNTTSIDLNVTNKASLVTDVNSSYVSNEQYSFGRNLARNSKDGDLGTLGNEPSNYLCFKAPYKIVGAISIPDDKIVVFSTDEVNSEIGLADPVNCTYKTLKSDRCLKFSKAHPITGVAKKDFQKGVIITFSDRNNPVRRIELNKIGSLSCDDMLLFKKIDRPTLSVEVGQTGNVPNGVYSVALAYVVNDNIFTDWYSITDRVQLNSYTGANSLEVNISNLDSEFQYYSLVVVGNYIDPVTKGATKVGKNIGIFSTNTTKVSVSDFINSTYSDVKLSDLTVQKRIWKTAGIVTSNSNYLLLGDLVGRPEENYQLKALSIKAEYVVEQVEGSYYEDGGNDIGYYRDENYDFYIQGVYNTGELTEKFVIPGRAALPSDMQPVSSADVFELDTQFADCKTTDRIPRWKVENTASKMTKYNNTFTCGRRVLGYGDMGYVESEINYPDNKATFGDKANKPRVLHKMPDECKVPRYETINGKTYINIIGVRFKNIPKFDSEDIVGYIITRSDRKGGNGTVIARGLMTNIRWYEDQQLNQPVMYSNYNVNDLSPDVFLSSTQTVYKNNSEQNYTPLKDYYNDKFSFYSPHTLFEPKYSLGTEVKIESEEVADITGKFEKVYKHPKLKLATQFDFWLAAAAGFVQSALLILGKVNVRAEDQTKVTAIDPGKIFTVSSDLKIETVEDLVSLSPSQLVDLVVAAVESGGTAVGNILRVIKATLEALAGLALKVPYSIFAGIREADLVMETIYNFMSYTDYVYQYNSHALFNKSICIKEGNKRRRLLKPATYIPSTIVTVNDTVFNNLFREECVYFQFNRPISTPTTKDNSRGSISSYGNCSSVGRSVSSKGSAFYATSKAINPNQYGQIGSAPAASMHSYTIPYGDSPILYGGDCIITRFQFQKRMKFFNQDMANTNYPDGTEYDYRLYRNIAYPRYWLDSTHYDFSSILSSSTINFARFSRTTESKHNLDCKKGEGKNITRVDNAYMYTSSNCVMDFYVEADYNPNFRDETAQPFYSKENTNLSQIFRSDRLDIPEEFSINRAYSDIYTTEIAPVQQRIDFDPTNPIPTNQENSVIYSLPAFNLQEVDNWQYFLPLNYFAFRESDFGKLNSIKKADQDRLLFLFSKSSPYISMGRDFLQLEQSGRKITIGDGGLFAQDPREIMPTDNHYGACTSRYAFSNTHLGRFYPSENQGRIMSFSDTLDDISRNGVGFWCKNYMPIFLYDYFPSYPKDIENPVDGVGYLTVFDSSNETFYITKRDFSPKKEYVSDISFNGTNFLYKQRKISLRDKTYFNDISWTLSYAPVEKAFISWHDWHPDGIIQLDNHFLTIKDDGAWMHNNRWDSFGNFYGEDFPFEIEIVSNSGQTVHTVRSLEYILEVYKYKNFGRDRFHVLNENFDRLIMYNTEQISPFLNLIHGNPNAEQNLKFPVRNNKDDVSYDIAFFKEENKYRVNQFWDSVKDRGEFSHAEYHLFPTDESGYRNVINPSAIDIKKKESERKKFRHYWTKVRLIKTIAGPNKFIIKMVNVKKQLSIR